MIKEYFSQFGEIENIETPFDTRKNKRKAYLFITFSNESEARKAASQECQEIGGKKFEVRIAIPREQANRRWKGNNNYMFYPYTMLPYMYPEYFYSYIYNNPNLYNSFYNPYELLNYDPVSLSRQFSTGVMINNSSVATRPKLTMNTGNQNATNNISNKSNPFMNNVENNHSSNPSIPNGNVFMSAAPRSTNQSFPTKSINDQMINSANSNSTTLFDQNK